MTMDDVARTVLEIGRLELGPDRPREEDRVTGAPCVGWPDDRRPTCEPRRAQRTRDGGSGQREVDRKHDRSLGLSADFVEPSAQRVDLLCVGIGVLDRAPPRDLIDLGHPRVGAGRNHRHDGVASRLAQRAHGAAEERLAIDFE
jgi:hypothetical protein